MASNRITAEAEDEKVLAEEFPTKHQEYVTEVNNVGYETSGKGYVPSFRGWLRGQGFVNNEYRWWE